MFDRSAEQAGLQHLNSKRNAGLFFARAALLLVAGLIPVVAAHADQFVKPTKEELEMTSLPGYPGAPAVVLYREDITKDDLHSMLRYERVKILTEDGKKYANVELRFASTQGNGWLEGNEMTVDDIQGRTIHSDGTIVPFTGKPYSKVVEKFDSRFGQVKLQEKVFTLPDVQVGSIIEYRYAQRFNDHDYEPPDWFIQGDLFVKSAHYTWYPTNRDLVDGDSGNPINAISWFPILPQGAKIVPTERPGTGASGGAPQKIFDLVVKDVPPTQKEEYMPPIASFTYRVLFNYTAYRTNEDFWKSKGKSWSKGVNSFADPNGDLVAATQKITAGASTPDEKLHKIYAAVMELENTKYTREREHSEDKAAGSKLNRAVDVLTLKRGSADQITELFVGMARAAGMKAYAMWVPDRSEEVFTPMWMNTRQFDDYIAIVNLDGKEQYFDPGSRYCSYGHLAWEHTFVKGLRQTESGTEIGQTIGDPYTANKVARVANLTMDEHGEVTGKIDMTYMGSPALEWRQRALRGDEESLKHGLRTSMEEMLPKSLEVKVGKVENLDQYEQPLTVSFEVKGTIGTATGKRLLVPADIFLSGSSATFPHEKRELPVYFHYPRMVQDALRINLPKEMTTEAVPTAAKLGMPQEAIYNFTVTQAPNNFVTRRTYAFNEIIVPAAKYTDLRTFYSQFEAKDQESVVIKMAPQAAMVETPGAN